MSVMLACARKEVQLLLRDIHGLLLLFIMPTAFILIMSLALQEQMGDGAGHRFPLLLHTHGVDPAPWQQALAQLPLFELQTVAAGQTPAALRQRLQRGEADFLLTVRSDDGEAGDTDIALWAAPAIDWQTLQAAKVAVETLRLRQRVASLPQSQSSAWLADLEQQARIETHYAYPGNGERRTPTAVQQSVPAWLVFAMFFIVVPLSNTFINERQQGTLLRLQSMRVGIAPQVLGKLLPYFGINQLQLVAMLLVGVFLVPLCGGEQLLLQGSWLGLAAMSAATSIAALGFALLIAVLARTPEQATTLGGTAIILLAAVGGVMVPTFVMPEFMQSVARLSPMGWGLEGFLDVLLRQLEVSHLLYKIAGLTLFGAAMSGVALLMLRSSSYGRA